MAKTVENLGVLTQNDLISVLIKILIRSTPRPCPGMCRKFTCFPFISIQRAKLEEDVQTFVAKETVDSLDMNELEAFMTKDPAPDLVDLT